MKDTPGSDPMICINKEAKMSRNKEAKIRTDQPNNKRLLVQVGAIFVIIFVIIISVITALVVKGNLSTYLEAKKELLTPTLLRNRNKLMNIRHYEWFLEYWAEHPEVICREPAESDMQKYVDSNIEISSGNVQLTLEELKALDPELQSVIASQVYYNFSLDMNLSQWQLNNENLFCMNIGDSHPGFVYVYAVMTDELLNGSEDALYIFSGGAVIDLHDHPAIQTLKNGKFDSKQSQTIFERYDNPKDGEYYYYGYIPIYVDNEPRYVIGIAHQWSDFHSQMMVQLAVMGIGSALIIAAAAAILLFYIHRAAIRPLKKIQRGMKNYMENKDSRQVETDMNHILQHNEFGDLASNLTSLAAEMDRYTEENSRLAGERQRVETELTLAAGIQNGALPDEFPSESDYNLYASMTPAKEVGGDFYDFFPIDETHVGLAIGDVSGKGVPASLYMMISQLLIRQNARAVSSPAEVLARSNQAICENNKLEMFVTAWFGILDRTTGKVTACSAGHEYPIIKKPNGNFELFKDRHGFVLGGMETSKYKEYELTLEPGSVLLVYTDGAPEATNAKNELYTTDRMLEALNRHPDLNPKELIEALKEDINGFVGDAPQFDDLTMLCVKYIGNGK